MAVGQAQPAGRPHLTGSQRFREAIEGGGVAFAPILWERLRELVRQPQDGWWRDPTSGAGCWPMRRRWRWPTRCSCACRPTRVCPRGCAGGSRSRGRRVRGDRGASDSRRADAGAGQRGDRGRRGRVLGPRDRVLRGGRRRARRIRRRTQLRSRRGRARRAEAGGLFGRPVLGVCGEEGWIDGGGALGVVSVKGEWPAGRGVVITPGDVSGRWSAEQLHAVGSAR